jgi:hypothetical protein
MIFRRIQDMDSRSICIFLKGAPVFAMGGGFIMGMVLMGFAFSHKQDQDSLVVAGAATIFMLILLATGIIARRMADELTSRL